MMPEMLHPMAIQNVNVHIYPKKVLKILQQLE